MRGNTIKQIVEKFYGVDVTTKSKERRYTRPRQVVHYLCLKYTKLTKKQIAYLTNINHHTTILFSERSVKRLRYKYEEFDKIIREFEIAIETQTPLINDIDNKTLATKERDANLKRERKRNGWKLVLVPPELITFVESMGGE